MAQEERLRSYDAQSRFYTTVARTLMRGNKVMIMDLDPQPSASEIGSRAHAMLQSVIDAGREDAAAG